jgi:FG-GAP repeat
MSWRVERVVWAFCSTGGGGDARIPAVLVLILAATVWPVTSGLAHRPPATHTAADGSLQADFDNDGFPDLAIGVIGEDAGTEGAVNVLYGTPTGLSGAGGQFFTQDSPGVPGAAEPDDGFGRTLAVGDFDRDGFADLAIGVLDEDVGSIADAGAVNVLYGSTGGLTGTGGQIFTQTVPGWAAPPSRATASATRWLLVTSTTMGSPTWPSAPLMKTPARSPTRGPLMCCTAPPAG